jgi:multicomponent Na+:H+ antiporter subunit E
LQRVHRDSRRILFRGAFWRAAGFFAFWLIIAGTDLADVPAGLFATGLAVWASLLRRPPSSEQLSAIKLARFVLHFLRQAISAGIDVALRALSPQLRIQPGFILYRPHLPPGVKRDAFCTETSLLPGTLPAGTTDNGSLLVHCLDVSQPVSDQLAAEEALFMQLFQGGRDHD